MTNPIHRKDPLDSIDGCMDGTTCPDAAWCRENIPAGEGCPLLDNNFELDPEVPLTTIINVHSYVDRKV
jgi:hypothetical protein